MAIEARPKSALLKHQDTDAMGRRNQQSLFADIAYFYVQVDHAIMRFHLQ
jgi:hypothetical protein